MQNSLKNVRPSFPQHFSWGHDIPFPKSAKWSPNFLLFIKNVRSKMLDSNVWSSSLTPLYSHSNSSLRKNLELAGFTLENPILTFFFSPWHSVNSTLFYILQHAEKESLKYWNIHVFDPLQSFSSAFWVLQEWNIEELHKYQQYWSFSK